MCVFTLSYTQDLSVLFEINITKAPSDVKKGLKDLPPCDFVMKFSGSKSYSKLNLFGMYGQTIVFDNEAGSGFILMEIGQEKIIIKINEEELNEYNKGKNTQPIVQEVKGSKKILGEMCKKALLKYEEGKEYQVYYSESIKFKHENFKYLGGFPLEYNVEQNKMELKMTASAIDQKTKIDPTLFEAPSSGYKEISFEELQKIQEK